MPSIFARIEAGTSAAGVSRAVLRACRGLTPMAWSLLPSESLASAVPGQRPGNSQSVGPVSRPWPGALRSSARLATRLSGGAAA